MGSDTVKLAIAEIHVALGLAAVGTLAATGHLDGTVAAGFIGGLLGIGAAPPLVAYGVNTGTTAANTAATNAQAANAPSGGPTAAPGGTTAALTPGEITGTATAAAMPSAGG